jgi:predicted metal-dependent peptidase
MADAVETKLSAASTRLILDKPFLGALVLRMPMIEADPKWCPTTATDARALYYNPDYIDALSLEQTQFVLAHEALHCALSHFARRQYRNRMRWDVACDFAINPLLIKDGLKPPPGALYLRDYEDMTAEEIYPCLDENNDDEPMDRHVYDDDDRKDPEGGGSGDQSRESSRSDPGESENAEPDPSRGGADRPPPLSESERERLAVQWQQRMAGAAQQAMQAGKLSGAMARMVDHLLQPQLPWRMLLARYMTALGRDDYNYSRPSRREGDAIMPSLRSSHIDIVVILDTSGSITNEEMEGFLAEVDAIKGQVRARIVLHACDAVMADDGPWEYEAWEEFKLPREFRGGGGTSFIPPFEWMARRDCAPDLLVYFTDAEGAFPAGRPDYPVLWLVKGKAKVPWGVRIQLN